MPFQAIPNAVEAVIHMSDGADNQANVLHFQFSGGYASSDLQALADAIDGLVGTLYLPFIYSGVSYVETIVKGLTVINDISATSNASAGAGRAGSAGLPGNVSFCVTLRTGLSGRSARGRFYAMPTDRSNLATPDVFTSTYGNGIVNFLNNVKIDAAAANWTFVVASRQTGGAIRPTGVTFPISTIAYRNLLVDSQRNRLPRNH